MTKQYGGVAAVRGVDFDLGRNRFVTILGPSGCGKTTILRMIGGFESVSGGTLLLEGSSLTGVPPSRRPVNTVFQNYALFPHLRVFDNVAFGLRLKRLESGEVTRRVNDALATVRMEAFAERYPFQLSGGQQQRVALARAFVNQPRLLLLDEPLGALDLKMRRQLQIELKDLQRRLGMTFLYVTHDQEEAFALSDWIIVMNDGLIEQQGSGAAIYHEPDNAFVADFIGAANLIAGRVERLQDDTAVVATPLGPIAGRAAPGLAVGEPAAVCIRTEQTPLGAEAARFSPHQIAQVRHVIFQGDAYLVEVEAQSVTLRSRVKDWQGSDTTTVALPAERVRIVRGQIESPSGRTPV
ncbi:MAG: ABC transporter ATP-binding protein [Gammaproteobacteria bacterium]